MSRPGGSGAGAPLALDRLKGDAVAMAALFEGLNVGEEAVRSPHRHDYHELIWVRSGTGEHLIDGKPVPAEPGTITVIGRGQVHQFRSATEISGGILRFADEAVDGGADRISSAWLLTGQCGRSIEVPEGEGERLELLLRALHDELELPADRYVPDVERHLISTLLLWLERWFDAARAERREADDADVQLHRRFSRQLEADFTRHHDAAHYAHALGVPGPALSRTLSELTGQSTKELITDRVMREARRLLRYSDLTVGEISYRVGFRDQLYFSRAFKRQAGQPPQAYRESSRGH